MSDKDEALRLAEFLEMHWCNVEMPEAKAAAELRRQHAEIAENESVINVWRGRTQRAEAERDALLAQLPEGMKDCTITFSQCERGHGHLSATNWVQHPCMVCERDTLREALRVFVSCALPVSTDIDESGHSWTQVYLDGALSIARAALKEAK